MHVLVFEPRYRGHHLVYVQMLVDALLKMGCRVTLGTGPEVLETAEYGMHLRGYEGRMEVITAATDRPGMPEGMHRQLKDVMGVKPDHVLVPSGDGLVQQCGVKRMTGRGNVLKGVEAEALILQCRFAYPGAGMGQRARYAAIRGLVERSGFSRLFAIDAVAHASLARVAPRLAAKVRLIPDPLGEMPVVDREGARRALGIPTEGKYIGMAGSMDGRKGIDRLVRAFLAAKLPADCRLLLAGVAQPEVKELMAREVAPMIAAGRAVWLDRYLSDEEVMRVFAALDVMCAPYVDHVGPSGVIVRSAQIGTPVLATDFGWCGAMVPNLGIGWVCDTGAVEVFAREIQRTMAVARPLERTTLLERWFEYLSPANFIAAWTERLRERMGLPAVAQREWEWVNEMA